MNVNTVADSVRKLVEAQLGSNFVGPWRLEATLLELGGDSLDAVEVVMNVEEHFDLEIPDEHAEDLKTMQQFVDYVTQRLTAARRIGEV